MESNSLGLNSKGVPAYYRQTSSWSAGMQVRNVEVNRRFASQNLRITELYFFLLNKLPLASPKV